MTDHQFQVELKIRAYIDQISGYPLGHPARESFVPITPVIEEQHHVDRKKTLDLPCYENFTDEDRALLLNCDERS